MFKASLIYLASSLFNKMVPFLLLPILTRYLSPSEYGMIALIQVFIAFFQSLQGGLNSNIPRKYFNLTQKQFSMYMSAIVMVLLCFFGFSILVSLVHLSSGLSLFGLESNWYLAMPVVACMSMANLLNLTLLRTQEKPFQYAAWEISHTILNLLLSLLLVIYFHSGWEGRAIGITTPIVIYGFLGLIAMRLQKALSFNWQWLDVKEILSVSIPLIPHALAAVVITLIDRLFIAEILGEESVGIYSVGYQFGMVVMIFTDAFLKAWQPWFFKKLANNNMDNKLNIVRNTRYYILTLMVGAVIYALVAEWLLPFVVDERYYEAAGVIFPVAVSYIFYGIYQIIFPYLVHANKTHVLALVTPMAALLNIGLNLLLIPRYGIAGAAYATIAAYATSCCLVFFYSNKYSPMPWAMKAK